MTAFQTAVYKLLCEKQTAHIYDDVGNGESIEVS